MLEEGPSEKGRAAIWGDGVHAYLETGRVPQEPEWVAKGLAAKLKAAGDVRDKYPAPGLHEIKLVLWGDNFEEASLFVRDDFPDIPGSVRAKLDYYGTKLGEPWIDDLKTGHQPPPPDTLQLGAPALATSTLTLDVSGVHGSITHWPRYPKDQEPTRQWHYFDNEELDIIRNRLLNIRDRAASGEKPNPGEHCRWCRCRANCKQGTEYAQSVNEWRRNG